MSRTKPYKRVASAKDRVACPAHAISVLLQWAAPLNAPDDWTPTLQQIIDKTTDLYGWVHITEDEAQAALDAVLKRQVAA